MITDSDMEMILDLLISAYGEKAYPLDDPRKMLKVKNLWAVMFADDDPKEVLTAVKDCIATLQFPPKIADIKTRIAQIKLSGQLTEMEVWQMVRRAVEDANSYDKAKQIYNALPPIIQRTVGSVSQLRVWRAVSDEQFETVIMSAVCRTYRQLATREAGYHALPADVQQAESWRIEKPEQPELPAPKKISFEKPEWQIRREEMGIDEDGNKKELQ